MTDEIYEENLSTRNTFRFSNNLYEAIRYFNKNELANTLLGNISNKLSKREIKAFVNIAYATNDSRLFKIALEQAVEINDKKTINKLVGDTAPLETVKDLEEFCKWIFKPTKVRRKKLGKINCLTVLADYIPDNYIPQTKDIALEALSNESSFYEEFDIKRPGIRLIGAILPRLTREEQEEIFIQLWDEFEKENPWARNEIAEQLHNFKKWDLIHGNYREELEKKYLSM